MAFRAEGLASERMRIRPEEGAGTSVMFIRGVDFEEYKRRKTLGRVGSRGRSGGRMIGELDYIVTLLLILVWRVETLDREMRDPKMTGRMSS